MIIIFLYLPLFLYLTFLILIYVDTFYFLIKNSIDYIIFIVFSNTAIVIVSLIYIYTIYFRNYNYKLYVNIIIIFINLYDCYIIDFIRIHSSELTNTQKHTHFNNISKYGLIETQNQN